MVLKYIQVHCKPNIALYLHENMHNCTIKLQPRLDLPKITRELWTGKYFSKPPPPQSVPLVHFFKTFF